MRKLSKLIAAVAAMALLMAMSTSAFAAGENTSPADPAPGKVSQGTVTINGSSAGGDIIGTAIPPQTQISKTEAENLVKEKIGVTVKANEEIVILDAMNLTYQENGSVVSVKGKTVKFTMAVPGVKAGTTVYVLHEKSPGDWEVVPCEVKADGTIEVTLKGLSPVYLAMIKQQANTDTSVVVDVAANKGKSPKTGF